MKRLTVMRHAKSDWGNAELDDIDRPLNDRGWKAARRIGRELSEREFRFDLVIASPAARVRETLDGMQQKFDLDAPIQFESRLYLASEALLLTLVRELPETAHRPLLVGHNPGLQQLLLDLASGGDRHLRQRLAHNLPTGTVAVVQLPVHRWDRVKPGNGELVELVLPKDLD